MTGRDAVVPVLAYRALGLGDLLTAVPVLRALARHGGPLTVAAPAWLRPVTDLLGVELLATRPFDPLTVPRPVRLAVNLHGRGPQSTAVLRALAPDRLWSYGLADAPAWDPDGHEVDRWCQLVAGYGVAVDRTDLHLPPPVSPAAGPVPAGATVVHPGGAAASRRWPAQRWRRVVAGLLERGHRPLVSAGPGERELARHVLGDLPAQLWEGDLTELCLLVGQARLVLCADTGVAHLASAYRTPSVVIFGPVPPSRWGPPADGPHIALGGRRGSDPFADRPAPALLAVSVAEVLAAADRQVAAVR